MRVYELARELGVTSRDLLATLHEMELDGRTASSNVPDGALGALRKAHAPRPSRARSNGAARPKRRASGPALAVKPSRATSAKAGAKTRATSAKAGAKTRATSAKAGAKAAPAKPRAKAPARPRAEEAPAEPRATTSVGAQTAQRAGTDRSGVAPPDQGDRREEAIRRSMRRHPSGRRAASRAAGEPSSPSGMAPAGAAGVPALDLPLPPAPRSATAVAAAVQIELPAWDGWPVLTVVPDPAPEPAAPPHRKATRRSPAMRAVRWVCMIAIWTVLGFGAGILLAITVPYLFGHRSLTVLSGSMEPAISTGDVVVVEQIAPQRARIGDVISFRDVEDPARLVTHRVRRVEIDGDQVMFVTKGDANTSVEQWKTDEDGTIGRVRYVVPKLGYALFWMRGRYGRLLLVAIPALLLGAYEIVRIWRTNPEEAVRGSA